MDVLRLNSNSLFTSVESIDIKTESTNCCRYNLPFLNPSILPLTDI